MNNEQKNIISELKKVPTQLPDDAFFDALKIKVIETINTEVKIVPFYRKRWLQIAASIVLLLGIGTFYLTNNHETPAVTTKKVDFSSLDKDDIIKYIEENEEDFENDELASLINDLPLEKTKQPVANLPAKKDKKDKSSAKAVELEKMWKEIDREEILHYLEEDNYDFDDDLISSI